MFHLTSFPKSPNAQKLDEKVETKGRAVEIAEKEDGGKMQWLYREVTNSHKGYGRRATYYITET